MNQHFSTKAIDRIAVDVAIANVRSALIRCDAKRAYNHMSMSENMRDHAAKAFLAGEHDAALQFEADAVLHDIAADDAVHKMLARFGSK